ncbi:MAG: NUDIX hydrolase [Bacteroidales bacterium]|nr:NUDIX hydrolase [Bacteroidales bacterium]
MKSSYTYRYPRPSLTADTVVFAYDQKDGILKVLLVERGNEPFRGKMALPGGFLEIKTKVDADGLVTEEKNETLEQCARRELKEETGLEVNFMKELGTFSTPGRDPRGCTISSVFYAISQPVNVRGGDDAADVHWFPVREILKAIESMPNGFSFLAFDHDEIIKRAFHQLRVDICFEPVGLLLLGETFTMTQIQNIYQDILGREFDRRNFARKVLIADVLDRLPHTGRNIRYKLNLEKFMALQESDHRLRLLFA